MTNAAPQDASSWPTPDNPQYTWPSATGSATGGSSLRAVPPADAVAAAPAAQPSAVRPVSYGTGSDHCWTIMSETRRVGLWQVPTRFSASVLMGSVRIDLREAELTGPVTTIEVRGLMGEAKIIVPQTCRVECLGSPIMGEFTLKEHGSTDYLPADAPLVRVTGSIVMGSVEVFRTGAAVGEGSYAVDGFTGWNNRRAQRREQRRQQRRGLPG